MLVKLRTSFVARVPAGLVRFLSIPLFGHFQRDIVCAQQQLKLWHALLEVELVLGFVCVLLFTAARKSYQKVQKECLPSGSVVIAPPCGLPVFASLLKGPLISNDLATAQQVYEVFSKHRVLLLLQ